MPVALNLYKIRQAKGPAGDLFRSVQKQKPQYQGLWLVAPDGKVLAAHQEMKDTRDGRGRWAKKVLADLEGGLKAFGPVESRPLSKGTASRYRQTLPHRGVGVRPDGGVTLAVQDRLVLVKDLDRDPPRGNLGPTVLDSIPLTAEEWASLAPPAAEEGRTWAVPEATARRFFPLLSVSDAVFRDGKELTEVRLTGRVERVRDGIAELAYEGRLAGTHHGTANEGKLGNKVQSEANLLAGVGSHDVKARQMRSLTLVFDGRWRNWAPYDDPPSRFGAVVEWRREAAER